MVVVVRHIKVCRLLRRVPLHCTPQYTTVNHRTPYLGVGQGFRRGVMAFGATRSFNLGVWGGYNQSNGRRIRGLYEACSLLLSIVDSDQISGRHAGVILFLLICGALVFSVATRTTYVSGAEVRRHVYFLV